jgi:peptide chain release factor subunit 1
MSINDLLDRLAAFEPSTWPVLSLYLNLQSDQHGRDNYRAFLRKEFKERVRTFASERPERESLNQDMDRITRYLENEIEPSANGVAVFASSGAGLFEAAQVEAPFDEHRLHVGFQPHVYPLARLDDRYPRYAALVADTYRARLFVFATGTVEQETTVEGEKTNRTQMGGWSQARFQRSIDNNYAKHAKEVIEALDRTIRAEKIEHVVLAGDEVVVPLLREKMPPQLASRVLDVQRLDIGTNGREVLNATLESLWKQDARTDEQKTAALYAAHRSGGLAVVGPEETLRALGNGQVDELLISAAFHRSPAGSNQPPGVAATAEKAPLQGNRQQTEILADEMVTRARQTGAKVTFIEEPELLKEAEGVGALLRYAI